MTWRRVTPDSPADQELAAILTREHLHLAHLDFLTEPWILGDGQGVALLVELETAVPERAPVKPRSIGLTAGWIAPEHRRHGYLRALLHELREAYGRDFFVTSHLAEIMGWLPAET